jgi:hypothetical protein
MSDEAKLKECWYVPRGGRGLSGIIGYIDPQSTDNSLPGYSTAIRIGVSDAEQRDEKYWRDGIKKPVYFIDSKKKSVEVIELICRPNMFVEYAKLLQCKEEKIEHESFSADNFAVDVDLNE